MPPFKWVYTMAEPEVDKPQVGLAGTCRAICHLKGRDHPSMPSNLQNILLCRLSFLPFYQTFPNELILSFKMIHITSI